MRDVIAPVRFRDFVDAFNYENQVVICLVSGVVSSVILLDCYDFCFAV